MAQELYYTSAKQGLQTGTSGYCTVARTAGMSRALQARLEELSTYRPVFPLHDPQAKLNPVVVSYLRVTSDGQSYSVLSRIAAAAADYSGRTNYLAYHLVIGAGERPDAGPAATALRPATLAVEWDGNVREIPKNRSIPPGQGRSNVCYSWQSLTGDAGWAGVMAQHLMSNPNQPYYLIFDPGMDLLPLIAESLALLSPERRWDVTFSTYFTGTQGGGPCTVRGVIRGSEQAVAARIASHLDLGALSGHKPPESPYVTAARTGQLPAAAPQSQWLPIDQPSGLLGRPQVKVGPSLTPSFDFPDDNMPPPTTARGKKWIWILGSIIAIAAILMLGAVATIVVLKSPSNPSPNEAQNPQSTPSTNPAAPDSKKSDARNTPQPTAKKPSDNPGGGPPPNGIGPNLQPAAPPVNPNPNPAGPDKDGSATTGKDEKSDSKLAKENEDLKKIINDKEDVINKKEEEINKLTLAKKELAKQVEGFEETEKERFSIHFGKAPKSLSLSDPKKSVELNELRKPNETLELDLLPKKNLMNSEIGFKVTKTAQDDGFKLEAVGSLGSKWDFEVKYSKTTNKMTITVSAARNNKPIENKYLAENYFLLIRNGLNRVWVCEITE